VAIVFVQQKAAQSTTSVSSFTTSAMTVTAGNALASATSGNNADTTTTTDSKSNVYNRESVTAGTGMQINLELATNAIAGATTFTGTPASSQFVGICVHEYSGVALAPVEANNGQTDPIGTSQTVTCGALNPPSLNDLYLSVWTHQGTANESFTPAAGWTLRANLTNTTNQPLGSEELIGSGSQVGSATLGGGGTPLWACVGMALRAADQPVPDDGGNPNYVATDFPMTDRGFGLPRNSFASE
jgi:hypothetical protein